jgi:hypothetical protein
MRAATSVLKHVYKSPNLLKVDLTKIVDPSFVQSAADRHLDSQ